MEIENIPMRLTAAAPDDARYDESEYLASSATTAARMAAMRNSTVHTA